MANQAQFLPAQDTPFQRLTCWRLSITTAAVFAVLAGVALLVPAYFFNAAMQLELLHAAITAGLLFLGWRGSTVARYLGGLGIAAGLLHMAPLMFFAAFYFIAPDALEANMDRILPALVYSTVLLVYYLVALMFIRRANLAARPVAPH